MFKTIEECGVCLIACTQNVGLHADKCMDQFPAQAARVSFANDLEEHSQEQDEKLINYLAQHEHLTPFEYQHATLMIECPLFIRSQIHRHRTFSYNEISRRYTSDDLDFWTPNEWHKQAVKNKQGSDGNLTKETNLFCSSVYQQQCIASVKTYEILLAEGVAREQARSVLPQSLMTRFYMGGNLRNWAHFLKLRLDSHAQYEIQVIAKKCDNILQGLWPASLDALMGN